MNATNPRHARTLITIAAATLALSGLAVGQDRNFDRPLGGGGGAPAPARGQGGEMRTSSQVSITSIEDDDRYEIMIRSGEVSARINGRQVPPERIRQSDRGVEILDENGNVLKSFNISAGITPPAPPAPVAPRAGGRVAPRGWAWSDRGVEQAQGAEEAARAAAAPAPRVMIGITMVPVPEALVEHLELESGEAVMVDRVIEGLPAAKAGLRARDLIVEVEGQRPVTDQIIRDHIRKLEPGDKLSLKVLRRGKEEAVTVTVDKFNPEKFEAALAPEAAVAMPLDEKGMAEAERRLAEGRLAEAERLMRERLEAFQGQLGPDIRERFRAHGLGGVGPEGFELFIPANPGQERQLRQRFSELDERLGDLERQMERLAERMDELMNALEGRQQRRRE